ncbi:ORF3 [Sulfolobus spindle-shaped virus 3]|nr:ORF3 [Sulfolobus spindle-shaped virus 3]
MMSALGDIIYVLGILIPLLGLVIRNYMLNLMGFVMGTIGFLVFVSNQTDITFSASTFYISFLPLAFGLINFAFFFDWLREERI